jgi:hypothetical protein
MNPSRNVKGFERTESEHRHVRASLKDLRRSLRESTEEGITDASRRWAEFSNRLFSLRDDLVLHFHQEESAGLDEAMALSFPHLADRSETLKSEHVRILAELRDVYGAIVCCAATGAQPDEPLRGRILDALSRLSRHEQKETELIQRLFQEELGSGD